MRDRGARHAARDRSIRGAGASSTCSTCSSPLVTAAGYDLEDVTVTAAGRRSVVRVMVDADGGIDLDAVADVSRVVSERSTAADATSGVLAGPYVLEVSSPGRRPSADRAAALASGRRPAGQRTVDGQPSPAGSSGVADTAASRSTSTARRSPVALERSSEPGSVQVEFNRAGGRGG